MIEMLLTMVLMSGFFYLCFPKEMFNRMMNDIRRSKGKAAALRDQIREAANRLDVEKAVSEYRPGITQEDLNAADWNKPWPSVALIEEEQVRIAHYLLPIWQGARFPQTTRYFVRINTEKVWLELQGRLHQKVFGELDLPPFFDLNRDPNGLIMFEMTRHDTDHYGQEEWIGVRSRWIYGRNPPQLSDPLSGAAT